MSIFEYKGPAREFSEGSKDFDLMLDRGVAFMNYFGRWNGCEEVDISTLDQQTKLGLARSMAIALEKHPNEKDHHHTGR